MGLRGLWRAVIGCMAVRRSFAWITRRAGEQDADTAAQPGGTGGTTMRRRTKAAAVGAAVGVVALLILLVACLRPLRRSVPVRPSEGNPHSEELQVLTDRTARVQDRAAAADSLGKARATEAFDALVQVTRDRSEADILRYKTARALGVLRNGKAVEVLAPILLNEAEDTHLRVVSALALGNLGTEQSVDGLAKALDDEDYLIRFKAVQGLERTHQESALPHVLGALDDPARCVRARAIHALGALGDPSHVPAIQAILAEEESIFIRMTCIDALGDLGGDEAVEVLRRIQDSQQGLCQRHARMSLEKLKLRNKGVE